MAQIKTSSLLSFVNDNWSIGSRIAKEFCLDELNLKTGALLQIPRIIKESIPDLITYEREMELVGRVLEERQRPYLNWVQPPSYPIPDLKDLKLVELSDEQTQIFHERFHYIGSYRRNSANFGLVTPEENKIACMASVSSFDIGNLTDKIETIVPTKNVMVLSRFFAFRWAPRNSFSYMFSKVLNAMKSKNRSVSAILTYLNPNLGFTGASYNPSQWKLLALEQGTNYSYVDGKYMTVRDLIRNFDTFERSALVEKLGSRYETSSLELDPLRILIYLLDGSLLKRIPEKAYVVVRPQNFDQMKVGG